MLSAARYYTCILILAGLTGHLDAQLSLKLAAEGGFYSAERTLLENNKNIEARFDSKLTYKYRDDDRTAQFDLRIRPEIYGLDDNLSSIKLKATGSYYQREKLFNWGINFGSHYQTFKASNFSSNFRMIDFSAEIIKSVNNLNTLVIKSGYSYRINETESNLIIDLFLIDALWLHNFGQGLNIGGGVYFEKFNSNYDNNISANTLIKKNPGTRMGPLINLDYFGDFILRISNYILFHNSEITNPGSIEYLASVVFGKKISSVMSLMLLVDYYKSSLKFKSGIISEKYLYFPSNIENQVAAKIGCDINTHTELYAKGGYFRLDLLLNSKPLTGWNFLIGLQSNIE